MNEPKYMWNYAGTAMLISIWSQSAVQKQLKATLRNQGIWDGVARYLCRRGFNVNGRQCRTRIKNILVRYRDAKKSGNISGTGIEPYFHDLDRVMTLRNTPVSCSGSALPYVSPDPLASLEQTANIEETLQFNTREGFEVNVKSELALSSNVSEDDSQDVSHDATPSQQYYRAHDEPIDDDQSSSSTHMISTDRVKSPMLNAAERCEVVAVPSPPPSNADSHKATRSHHKGESRLEQLVVQAIQSQTEAVTKILTAQHNFAKQLLEADRERQMRLEYKLDNIIERLDHFMPPLSLSSRSSMDYMSEERHNRLNRVLDRLDQVLPFIPPPVSEEDRMQRILNRLDQMFSLSSSASTSNQLNDDD